MSDRKFATAIAALLVIVTAASRVVPHPWNFTPMIAVALFAGARIDRGWLAGLAVLGCVALGDLALGSFGYDGFQWIYAAFLAPVAIGVLLRRRPALHTTLVAALASGFAFFAISNLAVFAGSLYPHSWAGLAECFTAALPFYRNQIAGDLLFTAALFGLHAAATRLHARRARPAAAARA
jgi:hypothetical protein